MFFQFDHPQFPVHYHTLKGFDFEHFLLQHLFRPLEFADVPLCLIIQPDVLYINVPLPDEDWDTGYVLLVEVRSTDRHPPPSLCL